MLDQPIAFVFPGQGSQKSGMGAALAAAYPAARRVFDAADEALGERLSTLCFEGPDEALALTANTQPAILTCSVAAWTVVREELGVEPAVCLGHSLGEFSALVAAGALDFADAVRLVRLRGEAMQAAVPAGVGAMAAIVNVPADDLAAQCAALSGEGGVVSIANENGGGQLVVAGHSEAVARLVAQVKAARGKAIMLNVSAPFHCALMQPAADRVAAALAAIEVRPLRVPVIANVDAEANHDASRVKDLLVRQITGRVRWEASVRKAVQLGARRCLELGHGKVLAGLIKRIDPDLPVVPVGSPAEIDVLKVGAA
ncbi:MAG: ACP S-malonyltransferase [Myxococcales bacterium]|nr:ACP S-malonyltransferase [Myxococcales bacterium]